jgi:hypothetical protein
MSRQEKLLAMEALWADLSHPQSAYTSPDWHAAELAETEAAAARGEEIPMDWQAAKELLRKRLP